MNEFILSNILGIVAAFASLVGSLIVLSRKKITTNFLFYFISIGAGFVLAVSLIDIIPESLKLSVEAPLYIVIGFFIVHFFEHVVSSHFHFGEETHKEEINKSTAWSILLALTVHTFLDGVSIAAGFHVDIFLGSTIFIAVVLHKIPDGFTVASVMLASGREKLGALAASLLLSFSTIAGCFWASTFTGLTPIILPISAGAFLHIAATDLIPEVVKKRKLSLSFTIFGGALLYYFTRLVLMKFGI